MNRVFIGLAVLLCLSAPKFGIASDDEVETKGSIQSVSDDHLQVNDLTFALTNNTNYKHGTKSDLAVGVKVEVNGKSVSGVLTATQISFEDESDGGGDDGGGDGEGGSDDVHASGSVSSVSGLQFTVNGITFEISGDTKFDHGTQADLLVGVSVRVEGTHQGDAIIATEIEFLTDGGDDQGGDDNFDEMELTGIIESVSDSSITVAGTEFNLTQQTKYLFITQDALATGLLVEVTGDKNASGGWDARVVKLEDVTNTSKGGSSGLTDTGILTDIMPIGTDDLLIVLDGERSYKVDDGVKLFGRLGLDVSAADLLIGLSLRIQYKPEGGDDPYLGEVFHLEVIGDQAVTGVVQNDPAPASQEGTLFVSGKTIHFDDNTELENSGALSDPALLKTGTKVLILASPLADGSFLANRIIANPVKNDDGHRSREKGIITGVARATNGSLRAVTLNGKTYQISSATRYRVKSYAGLFVSGDVRPGLEVRLQSSGNNAQSLLVYLPVSKYVGSIDQVGPNSISLLGVQFLVSSKTKLHGFAAATTLKNLDAGMTVELKVLSWPDGSRIVAQVEAHTDGENELQGMISDKKRAGTRLVVTIGGVDITVTPATEFNDSQAISDMDALQVGITIRARGDYAGKSKLHAREITIF